MVDADNDDDDGWIVPENIPIEPLLQVGNFVAADACSDDLQPGIAQAFANQRHVPARLYSEPGDRITQKNDSLKSGSGCATREASAHLEFP